MFKRVLILPALFILLSTFMTTGAAQAKLVGRFIYPDFRGANTPGGADDHYCSLWEAITEAQTPGSFSGGTTYPHNQCHPIGSGTPVTVVLQTGRTYTLTQSDHGASNDETALPAITTALTIKAATSTQIVNGGTDLTTFRFFDVESGGNLTLIGGDYNGRPATSGVPDDGGGIVIRSGGTATLDGVIFENNRSNIHGGAVANFGTTTLLDESTFRFNRAIGGSGVGGAFYNAGSATMDLGGETDIRNNRSTASGAGVYNDASGTLTLDDETQLYGNHINNTGNFGAGLYNAGHATVTDAVIAKNKGDQTNHIPVSGGGIYNASGGDISVTNTVFVYNDTYGFENNSTLNSFTGNCLYDGGTDGFSGGTSFRDDTGANPSVDGNWWGIASGPSTIAQTYPPAVTESGDAPSGSANGDVPADFLKDPTSGCPLTQLNKNSSFEPRKTGEAYPPYWGRVRMGKNDKLDCTTAFEDSCSFTVNGGVDVKHNPLDKQLVQSISAKGIDEYYFALTASSKGLNVPLSAVWQATVTIYYYDRGTAPIPYTIKFDPSETAPGAGWQHGAVYFASIVTPGKNMFKMLKVTLDYQAASGQVWWDNVRLVWCPYP